MNKTVLGRRANSRVEETPGWESGVRAGDGVSPWPADEPCDSLSLLGGRAGFQLLGERAGRRKGEPPYHGSHGQLRPRELARIRDRKSVV